MLGFTSNQEFGRLPVAECLACTHRFLPHPPTATALAAFYDRFYDDARSSARAPRPGLRDRALVRTLRQRLPRNARVLDIGANRGATLSAFPEGCRLEGVEPSVTAAAVAARDPRLTIHNVPVEALDLPERTFDCVVSLAVIEHVRDTRGYLRTIERLLAPGGCAVLMTGDWATWQGRRMGPQWHLYHSDGHLHFFSARSLETALGAAGLRVRDRMWVGPNPISSRLPKALGRALHCQTTTLMVPALFGRRPLGDHVYVWVERAAPCPPAHAVGISDHTIVP
ncbi:MAG: class I SAM-dependent methyltransferase [bacterium]|nr:class I SAM-dependent methyltransferase [bacterium]